MELSFEFMKQKNDAYFKQPTIQAQEGDAYGICTSLTENRTK